MLVRVQVPPSAPSVSVARSEGNKCLRCWKILPEVRAPESLCLRSFQAGSLLQIDLHLRHRQKMLEPNKRFHLRWYQ